MFLLGEGGPGQGEGCCFPAEGTLGGSVLKTRLICSELSTCSLGCTWLQAGSDGGTADLSRRVNLGRARQPSVRPITLQGSGSKAPEGRSRCSAAPS